MDTIEYAMFRYDTLEVENGLWAIQILKIGYFDNLNCLPLRHHVCHKHRIATNQPDTNTGILPSQISK